MHINCLIICPTDKYVYFYLQCIVYQRKLKMEVEIKINNCQKVKQKMGNFIFRPYCPVLVGNFGKWG